MALKNAYYSVPNIKIPLPSEQDSHQAKRSESQRDSNKYEGGSSAHSVEEVHVESDTPRILGTSDDKVIRRNRRKERVGKRQSDRIDNIVLTNQQYTEYM